MREHCDYSLSKLWELSEVALGPGNCDVSLMRRYARTSWRWMGAYSKGAFGANGGLRCQTLLKAPRHQRSGRKGPQRESIIEAEGGGS